MVFTSPEPINRLMGELYQDHLFPFCVIRTVPARALQTRQKAAHLSTINLLVWISASFHAEQVHVQSV